MSVFFYRDETGRCRVRRDGTTSKGEAWYVVEWKPNDDATPWQWYLCGTRAFLDLTVQETEWAESNGKKK